MRADEKCKKIPFKLLKNYIIKLQFKIKKKKKIHPTLSLIKPIDTLVIKTNVVQLFCFLFATYNLIF